MKQKKDIKLLVADDHNLFRQGLIKVLRNNSAVRVVGEAETGEELIEAYFKLSPDIILIDIAMPEMSGIEAVSYLITKDPGVKALFLSAFAGAEYVYKILKTGGRGLVNKNIMDDELFYAIEKVYNNERYFGSEWTEPDLEQLLQEYEYTAASIKLNFREEQVLRMILGGMNSKDIADKINVSKKSVDYYRSSLLRKLKLKTQVDLIKYGIKYFTPAETEINNDQK